jgi:hypothetical protein
MAKNTKYDTFVVQEKMINCPVESETQSLERNYVSPPHVVVAMNLQGSRGSRLHGAKCPTVSRKPTRTAACSHRKEGVGFTTS